MARKPRFNLRNGTDDPALIIMIWRYSGNRVVLSTGISIPRKFWNPRGMRVKETRDFRLHSGINRTLSRMEAETLDLHYEYKMEGIVPHPQRFKEKLISRIEKREDKNAGLLEFVEQFIEERKAMKRPGGSIQVYNTCQKHLKGYEKHRRRRLDFANLNETWKNDFLAYLYTLNFSDTHINKILSTLKTILKEAFRRGITDQDITARVRLSIPRRESENIYLTEKELDVLFNMKDLSPKYERVRDLFLIGAYTGLRFSDFSQIKPQNIAKISHDGREVPALSITTQKTKQKVTVPLTNPKLKAILDRNEGRAPETISNQKLNKYLKELAELAEFDQEIEINVFRGGKHERKVFKKWKLVSSHTARRSFATNAYKSGIPSPDIMKFTGHTTVASFMKYIKVTGEETAGRLADHTFFTGKEN